MPLETTVLRMLLSIKSFNGRLKLNSLVDEAEHLRVFASSYQNAPEFLYSLQVRCYNSSIGSYQALPW